MCQIKYLDLSEYAYFWLLIRMLLADFTVWSAFQVRKCLLVKWILSFAGCDGFLEISKPVNAALFRYTFVVGPKLYWYNVNKF